VKAGSSMLTALTHVETLVRMASIVTPTAGSRLAAERALALRRAV